MCAGQISNLPLLLVALSNSRFITIGAKLNFPVSDPHQFVTERHHPWPTSTLSARKSLTYAPRFHISFFHALKQPIYTTMKPTPVPDERLQIVGRIFQSVGISTVLWGADSLLQYGVSTSKTVISSKT